MGHSWKWDFYLLHCQRRRQRSPYPQDNFWCLQWQEDASSSAPTIPQLWGRAIGWWTAQWALFLQDSTQTGRNLHLGVPPCGYCRATLWIFAKFQVQVVCKLAATSFLNVVIAGGGEGGASSPPPKPMAWAMLCQIAPRWGHSRSAAVPLLILF